MEKIACRAYQNNKEVQAPLTTLSNDQSAFCQCRTKQIMDVARIPLARQIDHRKLPRARLVHIVIESHYTNSH